MDRSHSAHLSASGWVRVDWHSYLGCHCAWIVKQQVSPIVLPYPLHAGHYELNLALPVHAAVAARLRDVSNDSPDGPTWMNLLYDCAT